MKRVISSLLTVVMVMNLFFGTAYADNAVDISTKFVESRQLVVKNSPRHSLDVGSFVEIQSDVSLQDDSQLSPAVSSGRQANQDNVLQEDALNAERETIEGNKKDNTSKSETVAANQNLEELVANAGLQAIENKGEDDQTAESEGDLQSGTKSSNYGDFCYEVTFVKYKFTKLTTYLPVIHL